MVFYSFFAFLALWSYTSFDGFQKHLQRYFFHSDAVSLRMLRKNNTFRRGEPGGMLPKSNADVAKPQHGVLPKSNMVVTAGVGNGDSGIGNRERD